MEKEGKRILGLWLANGWTSIRMIASIFAIVFFVQKDFAAIARLFIFFHLTVGFDGTLARKFGATTNFGAAYDALATAVLAVTVHIGLCANGFLPWWTLAVRIVPLITGLFCQNNNIELSVAMQALTFLIGGLLVEGFLDGFLAIKFLSTFDCWVIGTAVFILAITRWKQLITLNVRLDYLRQLKKGTWLYKLFRRGTYELEMEQVRIEMQQ
jgi:phosphatidylglycerophosphate synthase